MNKLRQYWFGLDLGCEGTDCLIKWSGGKQRPGCWISAAFGCCGPKCALTHFGTSASKAPRICISPDQLMRKSVPVHGNLPAIMGGPEDAKGSFIPQVLVFHEADAPGHSYALNTSQTWISSSPFRIGKNKQMAQRRILLSSVAPYFLHPPAVAKPIRNTSSSASRLPSIMGQHVASLDRMLWEDLQQGPVPATFLIHDVPQQLDLTQSIFKLYLHLPFPIFSLIICKHSPQDRMSRAVGFGHLDAQWRLKDVAHLNHIIFFQIQLLGHVSYCNVYIFWLHDPKMERSSTKLDFEIHQIRLSSIPV